MKPLLHDFAARPGGDWVKATVGAFDYHPSFEDFFRLLHAVNLVETERYEGQRVVNPSSRISSFLLACLDASNALTDGDQTEEAYHAAWLELAKRFEIPARPSRPRCAATATATSTSTPARDPWAPKPAKGGAA